MLEDKNKDNHDLGIIASIMFASAVALYGSAIVAYSVDSNKTQSTQPITATYAGPNLK